MCFFKLSWSERMKSTKEIAKEYRLSHWAQIMEDRTQSGQSIKAYCRQIGISTNTYFYWQNKLRKAAVEQITTSQELVPAGWASVTEASQNVESHMSIEINGCKVTIDKNTDPELLEKTCRLLMSLC